MMIDGKFGILDFTLSQIKFTHFGVNTDGLSIDDGNNKLYPDPDKNDFVYAVKYGLGIV